MSQQELGGPSPDSLPDQIELLKAERDINKNWREVFLIQGLGFAALQATEAAELHSVFDNAEFKMLGVVSAVNLGLSLYNNFRMANRSRKIESLRVQMASVEQPQRQPNA